MKKTGHGFFSSIVCVIACCLYYACGSLDSGTTAPTPTPMSGDKLPLFTLNCSSFNNVWGTLDWTGPSVNVGHTNIEVVCLRGGEKREYYGSYRQTLLVEAITPSITPVNVIHISSSTPNMCTAALWHRYVDDHGPGPRSTIVVGPSFTSCDLPITTPTPTPMSGDKLPLFTLNCSSFDNVWGTLDWTRSGFDVEHTNIEVVCLHGGEKREYYGSYLQTVPVEAITPSITPVNVIHISSSMPNMCTAALWDHDVDDHGTGPPSTIVVGPSFTSCDLPITKQYSSPLLSNLALPTVTEQHSSPLLSSSPLPTVTELYSTPSLSSSPLSTVTNPVDDAIIVSATVPSVTVLVLIIFGSVLIASIFIGKKRRKSAGKKELDKETLELEKIQSSYFLEAGHCDKETVYDSLSEINSKYHVDDSHNYIDQNNLTINFTKPEVHEEIPTHFPGYKILGDFSPNSDQFQSDPINETINMDEMSDTSSKLESDALLNDFQLRQFLKGFNSENVNSNIPGYVPL